MQVHNTSGSDKQLIGGSFGSHWAILMSLSNKRNETLLVLTVIKLISR